MQPPRIQSRKVVLHLVSVPSTTPRGTRRRLILLEQNGTRRMVNAPNTTKARGRGSSTHVVVVFAGGVKCASSKSSSSTSDDGDDEEKEEKEEKADKMEKAALGTKMNETKCAFTISAENE